MGVTSLCHSRSPVECAFCRGPNRPTSGGCGGCVDERETDKVNIVVYAILRHSTVQWEPWPSSSSTITPGLPAAPKAVLASLSDMHSSLSTSTYFLFVYLSKFPASHSSPSTLAVYPIKGSLSLSPECSMPPGKKGGPLVYVEYMGGSTLPTAETHSLMHGME